MLHVRRAFGPLIRPDASGGKNVGRVVLYCVLVGMLACCVAGCKTGAASETSPLASSAADKPAREGLNPSSESEREEFAPAVSAEQVELRPIDQDHDSRWTHAHDVAGSDTTHFGAIERNTNKNRPWKNPPTSTPSLSFDQFLASMAANDQAAGLTPGVRRPDLEGHQDQLNKLRRDEDQVVSVTGYLVYGYAGPGEACEYKSPYYHDWHLELFKAPVDHEPEAGDPTPIICEVTRFTEAKLYASGVRLQDLLAFTRQGGRGHIAYTSTGHPAHKVKITGYVLWDDEHNQSDDSGATVRTAPTGDYHNPWRQTAWEIHPIIKIEDLGP